MAATPLAPTLTVRGATGAYPVNIRPGTLDDDLPRFVADLDVSRTVVITNTTLAPLYGRALAAKLTDAFLCVVDDGEQHKTLATAQTLYADLLAHGADRGSLVVALGGGVIGDLAGFVAATFMRGIAFVQAPTSLLAMVDASIGGKVGVDLPQGKNLVGAFKDPLGVFADISTMDTLPPVEFRCGLAEIIKAGLISDPGIVEHILAHGPQPVDDIVTRAVRVKQQIVEQDRLEGGIRAYLNLGHTFAHALEKVSAYTWKHGEAVALGLVAAARLSALRRLCPHDLPIQVEQVLVRVGLPVRYRGYNPQDLWDAMSHDKKWRGGTPRFVLLRGPGEPVIDAGVSVGEVIEVLSGLRED